MSVDALKPNKNTGLAASAPGATRIFPGGYQMSTSGASFKIKDSDGNVFSVPAGTSSVYLPKGASEITTVNSPVPTSWSSSALPSAFKKPKGACKAGNGKLYAIDNYSNIFESTTGADWVQKRTGTPGVELIHYESIISNGQGATIAYRGGITANDVSIVIILGTNTSMNTPSGYSSIGYTFSAPSNSSVNQYYKVLNGTETSLSYSFNGGGTGQRIFHFIVRGISSGSAPTFNGSSVVSTTYAYPYMYPATLAPINPGAFGIALTQTNDSEISDVSELNSGDSDGWLIYETEGLAETTSTEEYGWYAIGGKILDYNESIVAPINITGYPSSNRWASLVLVFEPVAATVTNGFAASDIAASPSEIVAVDANMGKILRSTDGSTWTTGSVGSSATATAPTVLWRYSQGTNDTSNTNSWTFPASPALQEGDLVIVQLTHRDDLHPNMLSSGWKTLSASRQNASSYNWSYATYYKVMGATPDTKINVQRSGYNYISAAAFRGASSDIRFTTTQGTSGVPNPPAVSMNQNSISVIFGTLNNNSGYQVYSPIAPSGYTVTEGNYYDVTFIGTKTITVDGTEDPAAFLDPSGSATGQWFAATFEVKPKDADGVLNSIIWDGTKFVGVGNGVFTSTNGTTWTKISNPSFFSRLLKIVFENGFYVAGSSDGYVYRSTDAITWSATKPSSYPIVAISYSGALSVVDSSGAAYSTEDFITWSVLLNNGQKVTWFSSTDGTNATEVSFTAKTGDAVVVFYSTGSSTSEAARTPVSAGWTTLANGSAVASYATIGAFYKVMGSTPDTKFQLNTGVSAGGYGTIVAIVIDNPSTAIGANVFSNSINNNGNAPQFASTTTTFDNSLLLSFAVCAANDYIENSRFPMGLRRGADWITELTGNNPAVTFATRRAGVQFSLIPYARTIGSANPQFWSNTTTYYFSTVDVVVPLKDTRPSAAVILTPNALIVGQDGSVVAAGASGVIDGGSVGATGLGSGASYLNGRQVNVLTSAGKQFTAGNILETAVFTSLG